MVPIVHVANVAITYTLPFNLRTANVSASEISSILVIDKIYYPEAHEHV